MPPKLAVIQEGIDDPKRNGENFKVSRCKPVGSSSWYKVTYRGESGWVNGRFFAEFRGRSIVFAVLVVALLLKEQTKINTKTLILI